MEPCPVCDCPYTELRFDDDGKRLYYHYEARKMCSRDQNDERESYQLEWNGYKKIPQ